MCYLSSQVERNRLMQCIGTYILSDPGMRETDIDGIRSRVHRTFADRLYRQRLERSRSANWMGITPAEALNHIEAFLLTL